MSRIVDLTHTLKTGITVYPGTQSPVIEEVCSIARDGFSERFIQMYSHTGTHIDLPAHILSEGNSISHLKVDRFTGTALKFNVTGSNGLTIEIFKKRIDEFGLPDFIIFETAWDRFWESDKYFSDFPLPDNKIIEFISRLGVKGVGIDTISIDPVGSENLPNHHSILSKNCIIIENLTGLSQLPDSMFEFYCFPLKIENGDGSPVRAVARIE